MFLKMREFHGECVKVGRAECAEKYVRLLVKLLEKHKSRLVFLTLAILRKINFPRQIDNVLDRFFCGGVFFSKLAITIKASPPAFPEEI